ncbi:DEAD/DEAH box helicase family protein [Corynebacterium glutamicum]|uniref:DEAD/DEAH box helicase family protein n=1 Tax=Corynebacterium glutamicum TaxID=1718 RepID=UPI000761D579|nr:DEAD/DEAH box helicase family protein [Corynebacterium glutamicum]
MSSSATDLDLFLFQELDLFLDRFGKRKEVPTHISRNLAPQISLREYQKHAFTNTLEYLENESFSKNRQTHLLYHMATGSGKTVMMAGLILHYFSLGYRNFLFFVNQTNIIEKTKSNFLKPDSSKYLFADHIEINGAPVRINEVETFSASDPNAVNICFTTTHKLHGDFFFATENSLSQDDFEEAPVVMIFDESHHVNTRTKKATKSEKDEDSSWEYTVSSAFASNRDNVLLEFTATVDLRDRNILAKYRNKIVFDYPLAKFRDSGFTKDFQNFQSSLDPWGRTLQALILSEYRRSLFADGGVYAKPVVLLKSQAIKESNEFYTEFFQRLRQLSEDRIRSFATEEVIGQAVEYFAAKDPTLRSLRISLQQSFAEENAIIMNGSTDNTVEKQLAVNSLEDHSNPYRIIFTVDMLNEGWDVLNLYDIVRLYETRQGGKGGKPGSYTIQEAQLIGRGARYFPFILNKELDIREPEEARVRKYDADLENPHRLLETLLYHSKQDSKYIAELRLALRETGLLPNDITEVTYEVKPDFRKSDFFKNAVVFANSRVEVSRDEVTKLDNRLKADFYQVDVSHSASRLLSLFQPHEAEDDITEKGAVYTIRKKIKDMPLNVVLGTIARFEEFRFDVLKHYFPHLKSTRDFAIKEDYLGNIEITFKSDHETLSASDLITGLDKVLQIVADHISKIKVTYQGTKQFDAKRLASVLRDKRVQIATPVEGGIGISQAFASDPKRRVNLEEADWYVYNDNFGTSEEKSFVEYFSTVVNDLKKKFDEVYLVRNERLAELAIYSFDTGERFEPDFLLFLGKKDVSGYEQQQIYVEPKGNHLLATDQWKENFLLDIQQNAVPHTVYVDDNDYRIIGLPFYNEKHQLMEFREAFSRATDL